MYLPKINVPKIAGLLFAFCGLTFWFILAFPFANHNESYLWVAQLRLWSLTDVLIKPLYSVANLRPLGQALAWLLFKTGHGSSVPAQIFNFVAALLAWYILYAKSRQKLVFGLAAFLSGGVLFAGYIYLFHIHGIFYSPLLIMTAVVIISVEEPVTVKKFIAISLASILATLFHVYALFIYATYIFGIAVTKREAAAIRHHWRLVVGGAILCAVLMILLMVVPRAGTMLHPEAMLAGLLTSYKMTELSEAASLVAVLFSLATVRSIGHSVRMRLPETAAVVVVALGMWMAEIPLILLWIMLCVVKAFIGQRVTVALLILVSAMFPAPAATGSPTYIIFTLLLCTYVTAVGWDEFERALERIPARILIAFPALVVLMAVLLRVGVEVPALGDLTSPLVAERERTFQMEQIIDWYMRSPYANRHLWLLRESNNPVVGINALDRKHRPPLDQEFLDKYIRSMWIAPLERAGRLMVMFGDDSTSVHTHIVYSVGSRYAGTATVADSIANSSRQRDSSDFSARSRGAHWLKKP